MPACPPCEGTGTVKHQCAACGGSGEVTSIETKIAVHLMEAPAYGLQLVPWEVHELGQALGLLPAEDPTRLGTTPGPEDAQERVWPPADVCYCGDDHPHVHIEDAGHDPGDVQQA